MILLDRFGRVLQGLAKTSNELPTVQECFLYPVLVALFGFLAI